MRTSPVIFNQKSRARPLDADIPPHVAPCVHQFTGRRACFQTAVVKILVTPLVILLLFYCGKIHIT